MSNISTRPLRIPGKRIVITKRMLENAIENTNSNSEAARWIGVTYNTYKKYAKSYGLWDVHLNQSGKGISKRVVSSKYNLDDILDNKHPEYPATKLKQRLISSGYVEEECKICGWNEKRLTDNKICLTLDFIDGDTKNFSYENLRLICPNCYYTNLGNFKNAKHQCM